MSDSEYNDASDSEFCSISSSTRVAAIRPGTSSLQQLAGLTTLDVLCKSIDTQSVKANFACGGSLQIGFFPGNQDTTDTGTWTTSSITASSIG